MRRFLLALLLGLLMVARPALADPSLVGRWFLNTGSLITFDSGGSCSSSGLAGSGSWSAAGGRSYHVSWSGSSVPILGEMSKRQDNITVSSDGESYQGQNDLGFPLLAGRLHEVATNSDGEACSVPVRFNHDEEGSLCTFHMWVGAQPTLYQVDYANRRYQYQMIDVSTHPRFDMDIEAEGGGHWGTDIVTTYSWSGWQSYNPKSPLAYAVEFFLGTKPAAPAASRSKPGSPSRLEQLRKRGWARYHKKDYRGAVADATQMLQINARDGDAYDLRGWSYHLLNKDSKGLADLSQAVRLLPKIGDCHYGRGIVLYYLKRYPESLTELTRAHELVPNQMNILYDRAAALQRLGRSEEAQRDRDRAAELKANQ